MKYLFTLMIALLPLTIIGQGSSIRALNGLGTNITLRGQNIIRTNLLVDASGSGTIGGTNVLEVQTVSGLKALEVNRTSGIVYAGSNVVVNGDFVAVPGLQGVILGSADSIYSQLRQQGLYLTVDQIVSWAPGGPYSSAGDVVNVADTHIYRSAVAGLTITSNLFLKSTLTASNGVNSVSTTATNNLAGLTVVSNLTVNGTANVATNLIVNTNTYIGPTNADAVMGKTYAKVNGGAVGATGLVFDYTTNSVNKFSVDTTGAMSLGGNLTLAAGKNLTFGTTGQTIWTTRAAMDSIAVGDLAMYGNSLATAPLVNLFLGPLASTMIMLKQTTNATPSLTVMSGTSNTANLIISGTTISTNGAASYATNATVTVASTGATNGTGVNYTLWLTAATGLTLYNNLTNAIFTGQTITTLTPVTLQPRGAIVGTAITSVGGQAW